MFKLIMPKNIFPKILAIFSHRIISIKAAVNDVWLHLHVICSFYTVITLLDYKWHVAIIIIIIIIIPTTTTNHLITHLTHIILAH